MIGAEEAYFNQKSYISGKDKPKKYLSRQDISSKNNSQETNRDEKISVVTKTVVQISSQEHITDYYEIKSRKSLDKSLRPPTEYHYKSPKKATQIRDSKSELVSHIYFEQSPIKTRSSARKSKKSPLRQLRENSAIIKQVKENPTIIK